jgi:hypothetical protein
VRAKLLPANCPNSRTLAVQLDRHRIHPGFDFIYTALRADLGCLWPALCPSGVYPLHSARECAWRRRASVGHVAGRPRSARTWLRRITDSHKGHFVGQGVFKGRLDHEHANYPSQRVELWNWASDWRIFVTSKPFSRLSVFRYLTFAGQLALVFHHQRAYRCPQPHYSLLPSP